MTDNLNKITKKIGNRIYILRENKGLSREELAIQIGVSHQQIFKYEAGKNRVTIDRLIAIAIALDLKLLDFFPASEFGEEIGNLLTPQSIKEIKFTNNLNKFKKLSGEEVIGRFLEFFTSEKQRKLYK